jgi:hypothetical protein
MNVVKQSVRRISVFVVAVVAATLLWAAPAHADGSRTVDAYTDTSGGYIHATLEWETIAGGWYTIRAFGTVYDISADGWAAVAQLKFFTPAGWQYPTVAKAEKNGDYEVIIYQEHGAKYLYIRVCAYKAAVGLTDCSGWK